MSGSQCSRSLPGRTHASHVCLDYFPLSNARSHFGSASRTWRVLPLAYIDAGKTGFKPVQAVLLGERYPFHLIGAPYSLP